MYVSMFLDLYNYTIFFLRPLRADLAWGNFSNLGPYLKMYCGSSICLCKAISNMSD